MCVSEKTPWILACSTVFEVSDYGRRRVAVVKDEEELVGHFLFDLDHFVVAHKVELGRLATPRSGCASGKVRGERKTWNEPLPPLAETRYRAGLLANL